MVVEYYKLGEHNRTKHKIIFNKKLTYSATSLLEYDCIGYYIQCPQKRPLSMFKNLQNIASFAQLQFEGINIYCFRRIAIFSENQCPVIVILTFNTWSLKVYRFFAFYEVDSYISIDRSPFQREVCRDADA